MEYENEYAHIDGGRKRGTTLLPEPEPRERTYTVVSVDDHLVEPPSTFDGRIPEKYLDRAPRVIDLDEGGQAWLFDDHVLPNIGFNASVGRPLVESVSDPERFDEMRRGTWDIDARIKDMDIDGVYASLNFPSFLAGFGGGRLQTVSKDLDLSLAVLRAYNDWQIEDWSGTYPDRIIPTQLPWLHDPIVGAAEIRRNAERGVHAITFPEHPDKNLGFASIYSDHWDPIWEACAETETVVCVHIGSAGGLPATAVEAPPEVGALLFGLYAMNTTVDWLYSMIPVRFPAIKICMSEGGIGWVAALLDRLDHYERFAEMFGTWNDSELKPAELFQRNFWLCALDDPSSFHLLDRIGPNRVMVEVDYPHADTSWPNTQALLSQSLKGVPEELIPAVTWKNASELFKFSVPAAVQRDPYAF